MTHTTRRITAKDADNILLDLWRDAARGETFASKALSAAFDAAPELSGPQRGQIADTLYGMLSHARRIDHILGKKLPAKTSRVLAELTAYRLLRGEIDLAAAQTRVPTVDWEKVVANDRAIDTEPDSARRIALKASLPNFIAASLLAQYGAEAEALALALNERAPANLRVNILKGTRDEVLGRMAKAKLKVKPTPLAANGITLISRVNVFDLPQFAAGEIEVQDEASQLVAEVVAPGKGLVVDFCAGAGGKTLALAALMHNGGRLAAVDVHERRLAEFRRRARRAGVANARAILLESESEWPTELRQFLGKADRVLVDVPCSGLGALRRKPELRWRLQPEDIARLQREQLAIARRAMALCAPGGRLIYSTCTLLREENEAVVEQLLGDGGFALVPIKEILGKARAEKITDATGNYLQLLPHRHGTDGFFAAVLRRAKPLP